MSAQGTAALRSALQSFIVLDAREEDVRRAVALFSAEARRRGLLAEQVLVLVKDVWSSLPEIRVARPAVRDPRLEWLTSETIRAYYASARTPPSVAPGDDRVDAR